MLTTHTTPGSNLVRIEFSGSLTTDEMTACHRTLEEVVAEYGTIRLLARYGDFDLRHSEPAAFWEDLKNTTLIPHVAKCAVVAHQRWLRAISDVAGALLPTDLRTFDLDESEAALAWLES